MKKKEPTKKVVRKKASWAKCLACNTSNPASATKCKTCGASLVDWGSPEKFLLPKREGKQIDLHQKITFWKQTLQHMGLAQTLKPGSAPTCSACGASLTGNTYPDIRDFRSGDVAFIVPGRGGVGFIPLKGFTSLAIGSLTKSQLQELYEHHSGHAEVLSAHAHAADAKARALETQFKVLQIQQMLLKQTRKVARQKAKKAKNAMKK